MDAEDIEVLAVLGEGACFGEQSFIMREPVQVHLIASLLHHTAFSSSSTSCFPATGVRALRRIF